MKNTYLANPAPLGLLGFGTTTILLNIHNAGFFPINSVIISMGIFYGGLAQLIAGLIEYKKGNTFGATAFTSYGAFWFSLVGVLLLPKMNLAEATSPKVLGIYLGIWGIYTLCMFIGTLKSNTMLKIIFSSLTALFFLLAIGNFSGNQGILVFSGYLGIFCGSCAFYLAIAEILNEQFGRSVLPIGEK